MKYKILYIEDDLVDKRYLQRSVRNNPNIELITASNIEEVNDFDFDVIISDENLGGITAKDVIAHFTNDKIIVVTGFLDEGMQKEYKNLGVLACFEKPFEIEKIINVISNSNSSSENIPDFTFLHQLAQGDDDFVNEMIEIFNNEVPIELQKIKSANESKDYKTVSAVTHKMKSKLRILGFSSLFKLADDIETYIFKDKINDELNSNINKLINECLLAVKKVQKSNTN